MINYPDDSNGREKAFILMVQVQFIMTGTQVFEPLIDKGLFGGSDTECGFEPLVGLHFPFCFLSADKCDQPHTFPAYWHIFPPEWILSL